MRIGLFIPCYIDAFFPEVGIATLELPERFGHQVVYPAIKPAAASQWLIAASTRIALLPRPCSSAIFPASITPWPHQGVACITSPASLLAAFKVSLEVMGAIFSIRRLPAMVSPRSRQRLRMQKLCARPFRKY